MKVFATALLALAAIAAPAQSAPKADKPVETEHSFILHNFHTESGTVLPDRSQQPLRVAPGEHRQGVVAPAADGDPAVLEGPAADLQGVGGVGQLGGRQVGMGGEVSGQVLGGALEGRRGARREHQQLRRAGAGGGGGGRRLLENQVRICAADAEGADAGSPGRPGPGPRAHSGERTMPPRLAPAVTTGVM